MFREREIVRTSAFMLPWKRNGRKIENRPTIAVPSLNSRTNYGDIRKNILTTVNMALGPINGDLACEITLRELETVFGLGKWGGTEARGLGWTSKREEKKETIKRMELTHIEEVLTTTKGSNDESNSSKNVHRSSPRWLNERFFRK